MEAWKDIDGYIGIYKVSNLGRIMNKNNKILHQTKDFKGYMKVHLSKDGNSKYYNVHRLVATAFINNKYDKPFVNHKDENKENNCVDNLEWCTTKENNNYGYRNIKISESKHNIFSKSKSVIQYNSSNNIINLYDSVNEASRKTGIHEVYISKCCRDIQKTAGGYRWEYIAN